MNRVKSYLLKLFVLVLAVAAVTASTTTLRAEPQKKPTPVDLNTADVKTLADVPGVGDKLAADIVSSRPFKSVDDLKKVKGIGPGKKFDTLKPYFMVAAPSSATTTASAKTTSPKPATPQLAPGEKININTATAEQLVKLPDVGQTKAKAIIDYRTAHGPFGKIEDVMKVTGIKKATFAKIKGSIVVR